MPLKSDSLKVSAVIPAEPAAVYRAWLNGREHGGMTGTPAARISARAGGKGWIDCYFTPMKQYFAGKG